MMKTLLLVCSMFVLMLGVTVSAYAIPVDFIITEGSFDDTSITGSVEFQDYDSYRCAFCGFTTGDIEIHDAPTILEDFLNEYNIGSVYGDTSYEINWLTEDHYVFALTEEIYPNYQVRMYTFGQGMGTAYYTSESYNPNYPYDVTGLLYNALEMEIQFCCLDTPDDWHSLNFYATAPVPEPCTMLLFGTGLIGLVGFRKKFKK